jgi:single-stranded DNA-binding protein
MTARVLIDAVLDKAPVRLMSKAGKAYVRASARNGKGPDAKWWTILVFSETAVEALESITVGEAFAASGPFEATIWAPEGRDPRVNLTLIADAILTARKPKAKTEGASRKPKAAKGRDSAEASNTGGLALASKSWATPATAEVETPLAEKGVNFDDDDIPF